MLRLLAVLFALLCAALVAANAAASQPPAAWEHDTRASQGPPHVGQNETTVAVNPLDANNAVVVAKDYRAGIQDYIFTTTDGGATWLEQPFPLPDPTLPSSIDPTVFF